MVRTESVRSFPTKISQNLERFHGEVLLKIFKSCDKNKGANALSLLNLDNLLVVEMAIFQLASADCMRHNNNQSKVSYQ